MTRTPIIAAFDHVWERLLGRLGGLTDEEYLWEPVPGCWSLHQRQDGQWVLDGGGGGGQPPEPVPLTTIAWRLGHIAGTLNGFTRMRFGDGHRISGDAFPVPPHCGDLRNFLDEHYGPWHEHLLGLDDRGWCDRLGPQWGPYANADTADLALHVLDEVTHHGAEVALLRDLWTSGIR
jgi:hypothetical protein